MTLIWFILAPIFAGVLIYLLPKIDFYLYISAVELALFVYGIFSLTRISLSGEIHDVLGAHSSVLGIELIADKFNIVLILLSILIFFLSHIYSFGMGFKDKKFVMLLFVLQGLLSGVFVSDDLFNIYVLLEVATVVVAILIMFNRDSFAVYDGMIYLFSQIVCMLFYLFGVGYLYKIFGVLSLSQIQKLMPLVTAQEVALPFAFIITAVSLKSALFPLFSWLPSAHGTPSAPSAVSAILSGLYIKNGIYLLFVFTKLFSPLIDIKEYFAIIGFITAVIGFVFAIYQTDIKLILAFSTISQMGFIVFALNMASEVSHFGGLYHIVNHALLKSFLFLTVGVVISRNETRDIREIHGVLQDCPVLGGAIIVGVLGITGAPFLNASVSKYFMQAGVQNVWGSLAFLIMNFGTILCFANFSKILFGKSEKVCKNNKNVQNFNEKSIIQGAVKNSYNTLSINVVAVENVEYTKKHTLNFAVQTVLVLLSLLCVAFGVFGNYIFNFVFDLNFKINALSYAQKGVQYCVMLIFAGLFVKYAHAKIEKVFALKTFSLNFLQIVVCIVLFFLSTAIVVVVF